MNATDILTLIKAGYTKADIDAMGSDPAPEADPAENSAPQKAAAAPETAPETAPAAGPAGDPKPAEDPKPADGTSAQLAAVLTSMQETLKAMQAANINGSKNPEPKSVNAEALEIMANIIAPPKKGNKTK